MEPERLVTTIAAALAALASLVGIVVAIDQLTLRSRMRRIVTWTTDLLSIEENDNRKEVLVAIRAHAAGTMVASTLVPIRHIAEGLVWLAASAFLVVQAAASDNGIAVVVGMAAVGFGSALQGAFRAVRMYIERERVRAEYVDEVRVVPPRTDVLAKMEGGTRAEKGWAAMLLAGWLTIVVGAALLFVDHRWGGAMTAVVGFALMNFAIFRVRLLGSRARSLPTFAGTRP